MQVCSRSKPSELSNSEGKWRKERPRGRSFFSWSQRLIFAESVSRLMFAIVGEGEFGRVGVRTLRTVRLACGVAPSQLRA